jgi:adenylate cyclase
MSAPTIDPKTEAEFREILNGDHKSLSKFRFAFRRVPSSPRCKLCAAPFEGVGGAVLRHVGFSRFAGNPALCNNCITQFRKVGIAGVEIPVSLLFADIRGSTTIGERLSPRDFRAFLDGFYTIASEVVIRHEGIVDKFVGDEVIGLFFRGITGADHSKAAVDAAIDLLERVERPGATAIGPIPLGAAVHAGEAYVGTTGPAGVVEDFTALGDVVNTTARLASAAAAGELLVSIDAATAAGLDLAGIEQRRLDIRGREGSVEVAVVRAATTAGAT